MLLKRSLSSNNDSINDDSQQCKRFKLSTLIQELKNDSTFLSEVESLLQTGLNGTLIFHQAFRLFSSTSQREVVKKMDGIADKFYGGRHWQTRLRGGFKIPSLYIIESFVSQMQ